MADAIPTQPVYLSGILLATFSFITMLLILPPMFWHFRNRNIGATVLIAWLVISLLINFVNALLWPSDDFNSWYNGVGLCDVEVKIQVASQVGLPASFACILRALAAIMDTDRATLYQTKAQKRRAYAIDLLCCIGLPSVQMFLHYVVQPHRYYIFGISGCVAAVNDSWLTILLIIVPPAIWIAIDAYFAVLILIRLYRYRLSFSSILASSNTTRSRFMRLYLLCLIWILCSIPIEIYIFYRNATKQRKSYSWSGTHSAENWRQLIMVRSYGQVLYDRWIPLAFGIIVFVFFGLGKEAVNMYRSGLLAIGFGRLFPSLNTDHRSSTTATASSFSSRARALFKRKGRSLTSSWTSGPTVSPTSTESDPVSPKGKAFLETMSEVLGTNEKPTKTSIQQEQTEGIEKGRHNPRKPSLSTRIVSLIRPKHSEWTTDQEPLDLAELTGQPTSVHSAVTGGELPSSSVEAASESSSYEVVVRKEVRQASEHAEILPTTVYHAY